MNEATSIYSDLVTQINEAFTQFKTNAEKGEAGHGSKTASARARKASLELAKLFKDYRSVSVEIHKKAAE